MQLGAPRCIWRGVYRPLEADRGSAGLAISPHELAAYAAWCTAMLLGVSFDVSLAEFLCSLRDFNIRLNICSNGVVVRLGFWYMLSRFSASTAGAMNRWYH